LRYKPGPEIIRHSKHGKRSVDQVRVVLEASLDPGCLDQSGINTRTDSLAANPLELSILGQYREGEVQPRRQDGIKWFGTSGSLALAGLISEDTRQNIDGFPGLKDVPILGTLFRSRDFQRDESELVIIVTPYLVKPVARNALARPDAGFSTPDDRSGNFLGRLNRVYGQGQAAPNGTYQGDVGYIIK